MYFPILINWTRPFPISGVLGGIFRSFPNFDRTFFKLGVLGGTFRSCPNFDRTFFKLTVETLIRRRVLRPLVGSVLFAYAPQKGC